MHPIYRLLRLACYALLTGFLLEIVVVASARHPGEAAAAWISEDGPVELAQAALAVFAAGVLIWPLARGLRGSELRLLLGLACMFAAGRELDGFFGTAFGPNSYKILTVPIALSAAWFAWRSRFVLSGQISEFLDMPSSMLVFAGALIVLVHAQVLGQKEIWQALVGTADSRTIKKTVEECSELTGYLLLAFAAIETELQRRTRPRVITARWAETPAESRV